MRILPAEVTAQLSGGGLYTHVLIWFSARNRTTGETETLGLWTGADHQVVAVGGQARTYYGAGALIAMDPITARAGLEVRQHTITVSPLADEVVTLLRSYDPRLAPIEIHVWYCNPVTEQPVADPIRIFKGFVMQAPISIPPEGGEATAKITCASAAWALTRGLTIKRSDAALRARASADAFRADTDISGAVECVWGENRATAPGGKDKSPSVPTGGPVREGR